MKSIKRAIAISMLTALIFAGCNKSESAILIQSTTFAKSDADGKIVLTQNPVYKPGDKVHFVMLNVGPFQKGKDGKNNIDMNMEVKASNQKVIFSQQNLLGNNGITELKNNMADSPYGTFASTQDLAPDTYEMSLTIFDKIAGTSASRVGTFTLAAEQQKSLKK